MKSAFPPSGPTRSVTSPLLRQWLARGLRETEPWLAAMNGIALAFLAVAIGGGGSGHAADRPGRQVSVPEPAPEAISMELAGPAAPLESPAAAEEAPEASPDFPDALEPDSVPEIPEVPVWREAPEMIDPVRVTEPDRPQPVPAPQPAAKRDPAPRPVRPAGPANPNARPGGTGPAQGTAPSGSRTGSGGTGPAVRAGTGSGHGWASSPPPPYPAFARRDRLQGSPVLSVSVIDGAISNVRVVSSSGSASLDAYAVSHVRKRWRAKPGTTHTYTQPFRFVLQ